MTAATEGTRVGIGLAAEGIRSLFHKKQAPAPVVVAQPVAVVAEPVVAPAPVVVASVQTTLDYSKIFWILDRNHDGILDEEEIALASLSLKKLDVNGDGRLTAAEYVGTVQVAAVATPSVVVVDPLAPVVVGPRPFVAPPVGPVGPVGPIVPGPAPVPGPHGPTPAPHVAPVAHNPAPAPHSAAPHNPHP
jgi:hypothetical protein